MVSEMFTREALAKFDFDAPSCWADDDDMLGMFDRKSASVNSVIPIMMRDPLREAMAMSTTQKDAKHTPVSEPESAELTPEASSGSEAADDLDMPREIKFNFDMTKLRFGGADPLQKEGPEVSSITPLGKREAAPAPTYNLVPLDMRQAQTGGEISPGVAIHPAPSSPHMPPPTAYGHSSTVVIEALPLDQLPPALAERLVAEASAKAAESKALSADVQPLAPVDHDDVLQPVQPRNESPYGIGSSSLATPAYFDSTYDLGYLNSMF